MASTLPVRFVCISDTYGQTPDLPDGDVLIHAGNLTKANFKAKIVVAGSQDYCLDTYLGSNSLVTDSDEHLEGRPCAELLQNAPTVTYLYHESKIIDFEHTSGRHVRFAVFGSPYSKKKPYVSAFNYTSDKATALWSTIPLNTDIVVTHTPAKYHCDESSSGGAARCSVLREVLWRVRPRLAACGHEHKGRGAEVVAWDLDTPHVRFKEYYVHHLVPATHLIKPDLPIIDLTTQRKFPLCNDGAVGNLVPELGSSPKRGQEVDSLEATDSYYDNDNEPSILEMQHAVVDRAWALPYWHIEQYNFSPPATQCPAFHGLGGSLYSLIDQEAISGREGRRETCIVNGAYMPVDRAISAAGSVRNSNPIIVDIDFPLAMPDDEYYTREALRNMKVQ